MTGKILLAVAGAMIAAAVACTDDSQAAEADVDVAEQTDLVCREAARCDTLWNDDTAGCHSYVDTCVQKLTPAQREEWARAVDACSQAAPNNCAAAFDCYGKVPWC